MTTPDDSGPASVPPSGEPVPQSGERMDDEDAPPSSGPVSARDADEGAPPASGTQTRITAAILEFLASRKKKEGRDFVIGVVKEALGKDVAPDMLEDIVQGALTKGVECRWPPWTVGGVPAWLARLTRREVADYFRKEKGRVEEPRPGQPAKPEPTARPRSAAAHNAEAARLDRYDDAENAPRVEPRERTEWIRDRASPPTDERARARLIHDWLAKQIGHHPYKVETLSIMAKHELEGHSIADLARELDTTPSALSNRIHKLRNELEPKVRMMDDEKTRRMVIFAFIFGGVGLLVAAVVWFVLSFLSPPPVVPAEPALRPVPSTPVLAPPPEFDNANPTRPNPTAPSVPSEPPRKR